MKTIKKITVMGLGVMGQGIVQAFASAGFKVKGYDARKEVRDLLHQQIERSLKDFVLAGLIRKSAVATILGRITVCESEAEAVRGSHFVAEAVLEDLKVKQDLFARLEAFADKETIFASNSSSFPMTQSAAKMRRPERAIVAHWFNPPHIVPVVEVVPGKRTSPQVTKATLALLKKIGKEAVRIDREIPGFVVNRVQIAVMREVWSIVDQGIASPEAIDAAISGSMGFRLAAVGPLEVNDFGGLDLQVSIFKNLVKEISSSLQVPGKVQKLIKAGHFGPKTGKGFYTYTPASIIARKSRRDQRLLAVLKLFYANQSTSSRK